MDESDDDWDAVLKPRMWRRKPSGRTPKSDNGFDLSGNLARRLVFPHPHDRPPCVDEPPVCIGVAGSVPFHLRRPVLRICDGPWPPVVGAAMPEASVDIDRYLCATEHNVCPTPKAFERRAVHPITETRRVQQSTDRHLWLSVTRFLHLHSRPDAGRARIGIQRGLWSAHTHAARRSAITAPRLHGPILARGAFCVSLNLGHFSLTGVAAGR